MTKKSKYLISIIIILALLTALAVIAASVLNEVEPTPADENEAAQVMEDIKELINDGPYVEDRFEIVETKAGTQVLDTKAGYYFTLPLSYGAVDITASEEYGAVLVGNNPRETAGDPDSHILAYSYNIISNPPERGAFWGDSAGNLNGNIIANFCERALEVKFVQAGFDSCEVRTNAYGVTYASLKYSSYSDWGDDRGGEIIYLFNSATNDGIVISNLRLDEKSRSDESAMKALAESISLTEVE